MPLGVAPQLVHQLALCIMKEIHNYCPRVMLVF